ncbi:MAG TPA: saccharopine dehydrogenase C-terminal domain-containing protein [Candidatus Nanoarchaeia archaeon]|nr:saccharopine dehydrogenase C-terminal domain-containing protein [Candidatus Nanoarchaeia archaeon]
MDYDFIIFGGTGQQGRICAKDLLDSGYKVLLNGRDPSKIQSLLKNKNAGFVSTDLRNQEDIIKAIEKSGAEVVINCAELIFNVPIMIASLATKRHCTDLGGLQDITQEQFKLDKEFQKKDLLCITGCGSTPGIINVLVAHVVEELDKVEQIDLGFAWNSNLKEFVVPYSIRSIFDEFTTPPIIFYNGKFVKSDRVRCQGTANFKAVGKQTTYCIVHSEVFSFAKYFKSKGLKTVHYMAGFPQHSLQTIQTLIKLGFSSNQPIKIHDQEIKPASFTTELLKRLQPPIGYKETENLWARIQGTKNKKPKKIAIDCIIQTQKGWEEAGSNVDTGRTIAIMSEMIKKGMISQRGVCAPEAVIPHKIFINELSKRNMHVYINNKKIT